MHIIIAKAFEENIQKGNKSRRNAKPCSLSRYSFRNQNVNWVDKNLNRNYKRQLVCNAFM